MSAPQTSESIRPLPGAGDAPAPIAPPAPAPARQGYASDARAAKRRAVAVEAVLAALVLTFAFLVASFVARNADVWLHLATGRLLAHGRYAFGVDPFSYTTAGVYWANHAWLYDLGSFLLYSALGGEGLTALKAIVIAALAGVMLLIRQPGKAGWAPAFCTALALLAMSPRLLLGPGCLSLALTGLTLWLLWRGRDLPQRSAPPRRFLGLAIDARAWLVPLCALWVNLDDWFLLGPVLAVLFWLGDRMTRGTRPTPGWLPLACVLACLSSPHHVFAFTPPADLYPLPFSGGLLQDVRFQRLAASPWQLDPALRSPAGANIAGLAYFVLVGVAVASFAVNRAGLRDWRVLVFAFFAALGALQVRLIPYFAVAAGPVAALNFQDMAYRAPAAVTRALHAACVLLLLGLVALAVPGWHFGFGTTARQTAWGVEIDPSLRRAAETLDRWRADGLLAEGERSFALHPDAACYCAWFCRNEKAFLDDRFNLFSGQAGDYAAACRAVDPGLAVREPGVDRSAGRGLDQVFSQRGVAVVLVSDPDLNRVLSALARLQGRPDEWTLLSVDGQALIFGWNPARRDGDAFARLRMDPSKLAFAAPAREEAAAAPAHGPQRDPAPPDWTSHIGPPRRTPAWESGASGLYMRLFQDDLLPGRSRQIDDYYRAAFPGFTGMHGLPAGGPPPGGAPGLIAPILLRQAALDEVLPDLYDKPPGLPLLAVRAARRAVAADPDDANAYLQLAQAYLALGNETVEHSRGAALSPLAMIRHVQIAAALHSALVLNPDLDVAHEMLYRLFFDSDYKDAALVHREAHLRAVRRAGPLPGEGADAYKRRLDALDREVQQLEKAVQDRKDLYAIQSRQLSDDPLGKAELSLKLGLAAQALDDVLMNSRVELFGTAGARRELELLLLLGRAREAKAMLDDEQMKANKQKLTIYEVPVGGFAPGDTYAFPAYEWLHACASAAVGDYDPADVDLAAAGETVAARVNYTRTTFEELGARAVALDVCSFTQPHLAPLALFAAESEDLRAITRLLRAQQADVLVLRGMLDLERGETPMARERLDDALRLVQAPKDPATAALGRRMAEVYLKNLRAAEH